MCPIKKKKKGTRNPVYVVTREHKSMNPQKQASRTQQQHKAAQLQKKT